MNDRLTARTHQLLVEQDERLEQQREAMRKALYAPLRTDADLPRRACSRCESGLSRCVTPDACELADEGDALGAARGIVRAVIWGLVLWMAAGTAAIVLATQ